MNIVRTTLLFLVISTITFGQKNKPERPKFKPIADYPIIKDSSDFIKKLRAYCRLEVDEPRENCFKEQITHYNKIKLYGDSNDYVFIEYAYGCGCEASYPWKYQLLFTKEGKLLKKMAAIRFELLTVFDKQNPFLLIVNSTGQGNGGHELYRVRNGVIVNVYDGFRDYFPRTYDAHGDENINSPH